MDKEEIFHDEIVDMIFALRELIGYKLERKWRYGNYDLINIIWFKPPRTGPKFVFEVYLKEGLQASLLRIMHAYELWKSVLFLILNRGTYWNIAKTFLKEHGFKDKVTLLRVKDIEEFCEFKRRFEWLERKNLS